MAQPPLTARSVRGTGNGPALVGGHRWALRDGVAAAALFAGTAGTVLWQNAHIAVLWDFSYVLESAVRMAHGQMPYRDFPLVHAPLTFLVQAAIVGLFGRVYWHHVLYCAAAGGAGTVLAWRLALDVLRGRVRAAWTISLLLAAPLTVLGIYCIVPLPNYDCDCALAILFALWMLERADARPGFWRAIAAGGAACVPLLVKQNMGLPFLAAVAGAALWLLAARSLPGGEDDAEDRARGPMMALPAGVAATLLLAAATIQLTAGLGNYLHWTIRFAAQRRLPGLGLMLDVFRDPTLLWTLPCAVAALALLRSRVGRALWAQMAAMALLAAPFVYALASLILYDDADERGDRLLALWPFFLVFGSALALWRLLKPGRAANLRAFVPFLVLAAIYGAFLSQQLWGSTYAVWPLLVLLLAEMIAFVGELRASGADRPRSWFAPALAALISATLLVCGGFYTASEERLSYAQFPDGPAERSAFPELRGMATPGEYLPQFDELLRYAAANIPENDGLILLPGEDPFYFVTGRVPQFPVLLFDPATDPYSPEETAALVRARNTHWLIVKRDLQMKEDPTPERAALLKALMSEFTPAAQLRGYDVYRR